MGRGRAHVFHVCVCVCGSDPAANKRQYSTADPLGRTQRRRVREGGETWICAFFPWKKGVVKVARVVSSERGEGKQSFVHSC